MGDGIGTNKHPLPPEGVSASSGAGFRHRAIETIALIWKNGTSPCSPLLNPASSSGVAYRT